MSNAVKVPNDQLNELAKLQLPAMILPVGDLVVSQVSSPVVTIPAGDCTAVSTC